MKSLYSLALGTLSSLFLTVGLLKAAHACDPHLNHSSLGHTASVSPTPGCTTPCQIAAPGCTTPCQIAAPGCTTPCQIAAPGCTTPCQLV